MKSGGINIVPERHLCRVGEIVNSRYRIVSELGEGSFGHVYKATDPAGRYYAIKLLHLWDVPSDIRKPLVDRFEMEYETGRISSEYLVHSVDIGYLAGNPYIVMEFCPGGDLCPKIGDDGERTAKYARDILCGLYALHSNGKVHRDLKPENVLIKENGIAALTDFGIAGDRNRRMTERNVFGRPYQMFGTYAYMPPEQVNRARGGSTVLPTTDIFSFGVLLYQLVTGKLPFGKLENQNDLVYYQKKSAAGDWDMGSLFQKSRGRFWKNALEKCLAPDYRHRAQSVREIMDLIPNFGVSQNSVTEPVRSQNPVKGFSLRILQGIEYGKLYDISAFVKDTGRCLVTVGRGNDNVFVLKDYQSCHTSRNHFCIEIDPVNNVYLIRDGQWNREERQWHCSSNGTFVNSTEITQSGHRLVPGDIISAGEITIRFETY